MESKILQLQADVLKGQNCEVELSSELSKLQKRLKLSEEENNKFVLDIERLKSDSFSGRDEERQEVQSLKDRNRRLEARVREGKCHIGYAPL